MKEQEGSAAGEQTEFTTLKLSLSASSLAQSPCLRAHLLWIVAKAWSLRQSRWPPPCLVELRGRPFNNAVRLAFTVQLVAETRQLFCFQLTDLL